MNQPPVFRYQFLAPPLGGVPQVAAAFELFTYASGTTTPAPTYQNQDGSTVNTNPIILDGDGCARIWLDPSFEYTFELRYPASQGGATVWTEDDIAGAAATTSVVTKVNEKTGEVELEAADIPYTQSTGLTWLTATTVEEALDQIADHSDKPKAADVSVVDAEDYFADNTETGDKDVEDILQQLGKVKIPDTSGHSGKFLGTDGTTPIWRNARTHWTLAANAGVAANRSIRLEAGTYQVSLDSRATIGGDGYSVQYKQQATIGAVTLEAVLTFSESGGFGADQSHGSVIVVDVLIVGAEADFTMEIKAATTAGCTGLGSMMVLERTA